MTEYELSVMPNNNCVLFIRGEHPFFCTKYPLEKHPNYKRSGDANDKYLYDVSEQVYTGINRRPIEEKDLYTQMYEECQQADIRDAEREHRLRMRPMEQASARGRKLGQSQRLTDAAREYVREHIPEPANVPTEEDLIGMLNQSFGQEAPPAAPEVGEGMMEDLFSSIVDYWEMDEGMAIPQMDLTTEPDTISASDTFEDDALQTFVDSSDFVSDADIEEQDFSPPDFDDQMEE